MRLGIISFPNTENTSSVKSCISTYLLIYPYYSTNDVTLNVTPDFLYGTKSPVNTTKIKE